MTTRIVNRRRLLETMGSAAAAVGFDGVARPYRQPRRRPAAHHPWHPVGRRIGSIPAMVWARADRPSRMKVEVATTDSFKTIHSGIFVDALPESDFTAKALLEGLPAGQDIFYRIRFADLSAPTVLSEPMTGRFRTAPADRRSVSFVWSGDTAGQGWGIDEARGGMRTYATMLKNRPDFFIHNGDTIYADGPIAAEVKLPDGTLWKNIVTEDKSKPAETLAEFRGNFKYNLMDKNRAGIQRRGSDVRAMGRSRGHTTTGGRARRCRQRAPQDELPIEQRVAARGARQPSLPRIYADSPDAERSRPRLSQDCLRPAARRVHARHAELSWPER